MDNKLKKPMKSKKITKKSKGGLSYPLTESKLDQFADYIVSKIQDTINFK